MVLTTHKSRAGRAIPGLCGPSVTKIYMFFFGSETQDVYYCTKNDEVVTTKETALLEDSDDAVYSAQYKAYPAKQDGDIIYNSVMTTKPILHNNPGPEDDN